MRRTKARDSRWKTRSGALDLLATACRRSTVVLTAGSFLGRAAPDLGYPIAISAWDGGCVLLDPGNGRVARHLASEHLSLEQLRLRDRFAAHFRTPAYALVNHGPWLFEEYIDGVHMSVLTESQQLEVVGDFLESCRRLIRHEAGEPRTGNADHLLSAEVTRTLPEVLSGRLAKQDLLRDVTRWPWVPTTGDFSLKNVIVADGRPHFIDVMPIVGRPFFDLPITALTSWGASLHVVRAAHLRGYFDQEIAGLFEAAGYAYDPTLRERQGLIALCLAMRAVSASRTATELDRGALEAHAREILRSMGLDAEGAWEARGCQ